MFKPLPEVCRWALIRLPPCSDLSSHRAQMSIHHWPASRRSWYICSSLLRDPARHWRKPARASAMLKECERLAEVRPAALASSVIKDRGMAHASMDIMRHQHRHVVKNF
jgi:hypothetical protein